MNSKIKGVFFILILGSFCTVLLLGIKNYTYPRIARYQELKLKTCILEVAGQDYTLDNFEQVFAKNMRQVEKQGLVYYLTPDDLYIFKFEGRGLWGMIEVVLALDPDLETIHKIQIVSQEETPGLGGRISEESFLDQFKAKKIAPRLELVLRRKATAQNEIDSISGASMTSAALLKIINESVEKFRQAIRN